MEIIEKLIETPTQENIDLFFKEINQIEYKLLQEAETFPYKSQDYFSKRTEAFSVRRNISIKLINLWNKKYGSSENCPVKYADTLIIPFQSIKTPI